MSQQGSVTVSVVGVGHVGSVAGFVLPLDQRPKAMAAKGGGDDRG
jgi:hypothetical protein